MYNPSGPRKLLAELNFLSFFCLGKENALKLASLFQLIVNFRSPNVVKALKYPKYPVANIHRELKCEIENIAYKFKPQSFQSARLKMCHA